MSALGNKEVMAENLSFYLQRSGKTQKDIAELVGVSTSTFSDWIKAKKYPRIDKIEILANYFGILKSDLIEKQEPERAEMQKKNDVLSDIILKMNEDMELLSMVETLANLGFEQRQAVKPVLNALAKADK
jgi:transcriptional regulator with XRE-family HTH domain